MKKEGVIAEPIVKKLSKWLSARGLSNIVIMFLVFWLFLSLSLIIHESGHVLGAWGLGCEANIINLNVMTGHSGVLCPDNPAYAFNMMIIALVGPLLAFFVGLFVWFFEGKDSIMRVLGLILFFFSTLPSLYPNMAGNDMFRAMEFGLPPGWAWLIFIVVTSIVAILVSREVVDREFIF